MMFNRVHLGKILKLGSMGNIRKLMITVDVEAQPGRAEKDHLDRLIWGKFPHGRCGIGEMMDVADKYGAKITMFLDYCEEYLYGDALFDRISRLIKESSK